MPKPYSKRGSFAPEILTYKLNRTIRLRLIAAIEGTSTKEIYPGYNEFLDSLARRVREEEGFVERNNRTLNSSFHLANAYFLECPDDKAIDWIEYCFQENLYEGGNGGVVRINEILKECGVGFEFTTFRKIETASTNQVGALLAALGNPINQTLYPEAIKKGDERLHEEVVRPCLNALAHARFAVANTEMLKAFSDYRHGSYDDSITSCGAAFESVLKTICDGKGWPFNPDKDTCNVLVNCCCQHDLFPSFYVPIFVATGTIRNKLGDAHGRGPRPLYNVRREHVEHMLYMTASHIVLLIDAANSSPWV